MKPVKPIHTDDISSMGKIIDQVTGDDARDVKRHIIPIFRRMW